MKTTTRFEKAIQKLYSAFHDNTLYPECCKQCAVGNILDRTDAWKHLSDHHGSLQLNYVGKVHEMMGRRFNGYLPSELLQIEVAFLKGCGYSIPLRQANKSSAPVSKEILFNGLSRTITFLCKLEGIKNIMDYTILFDSEANLSVGKSFTMPLSYDI